MMMIILTSWPPRPLLRHVVVTAPESGDIYPAPSLSVATSTLITFIIRIYHRE